jgi:hypothetical protein
LGAELALAGAGITANTRAVTATVMTTFFMDYPFRALG